MMKWLLAVGATGVVLGSGCVSAPPEPNPGAQQMIRELEAMNAKLAEMNKVLENSDVSGGLAAYLEKAAAADERWVPLTKVKLLGAAPTDEEIVAYVKAVLEAVASGKSAGGNDPANAMLSVIGPEHLAAYLAVPLKDHWIMRHYYNTRLNAMKSDVPQEEVLRLLPENPRVIQLVNPSPEANKIIRGMLAGSTLDLGEMRSRIIETIDSPEALGEVSRAFVKNPRASFVLDVIARLDGVDAPKLAGRAWEAQKSLPEPDRCAIALVAARYGNVEALEFAVDRYSADPELRKKLGQVRSLLNPPMAKGVKEAQFKEHYEKYRGQWKYDSAAKKFNVPADEAKK